MKTEIISHQFVISIFDNESGRDPQLFVQPSSVPIDKQWMGFAEGCLELLERIYSRHKRPIEPDRTGRAKTVRNGTAKGVTESNGKNDGK